MRMNKPAADPLDASVELFKAFADPVRLRLLNLLAEGEVCVCHLHEALDLPQSTVSRHLAYLGSGAWWSAARRGSGSITGWPGRPTRCIGT